MLGLRLIADDKQTQQRIALCEEFAGTRENPALNLMKNISNQNRGIIVKDENGITITFNQYVDYGSIKLWWYPWFKWIKFSIR